MSNGFESIGIDTIDIISRIELHDDLCKVARISGLADIGHLSLKVGHAAWREPTDLPLGNALKVGRRIVDIEFGTRTKWFKPHRHQELSYIG